MAPKVHSALRHHRAQIWASADIRGATGARALACHIALSPLPLWIKHTLKALAVTVDFVTHRFGIQWVFSKSDFEENSG